MSIEEKAESVLEAKFKDKRLELRLMKYVCTVNPSICGSIDRKWFSIDPIKAVYDLSRSKKIPLTKDMVKSGLKKAGVYKETKDKKGGSQAVYDHYIDNMFKMSIDGLSSANIQELVRMLYDLYESRRVLFTITKIVTKIDEFDLSDVKSKFRSIVRSEFQPEQVLTGDYLADYEKRVELIKAKADSNDAFIPTGISKLDYHIGGVMSGEFGVIAGRTGLGKTAMMVCMAVHAWLSGYNVAFATGEMKNELIQSRIDSNLTNISGGKFRTGDFEDTDFTKWESILLGLRDIQDSFFEVGSFSRNFNTDNLADWMHRIQDKHGKQVHILFADYLNIMDSVKSGKDRGEWQSQANSVWDFKTLVETFNKDIGGIGAWTGGQVKDEAYSKDKLALDDLKYARAISETAPIVMGLVRTEDDILFNTMQAQMIKMRNATPLTDPIMLYPNLDVMRINNYADTKCKSLLDLEPRQKEEEPKKKRRGGKNW